MRAVLQRVTWAAVSVDGAVVGAIDRGLFALVGAHRDDTAAAAAELARRAWGLRIFDTDTGERSASDLGLPVLVVSQFTLHADTSRGRRPSWSAAAPAAAARGLVDSVVAELRTAGARVATGEFGADMSIELVADGPMTVILDV